MRKYCYYKSRKYRSPRWVSCALDLSRKNIGANANIVGRVEIEVFDQLDIWRLGSIFCQNVDFLDLLLTKPVAQLSILPLWFWTSRICTPCFIG